MIRILVVDDEADFIMLLSLQLKRQGYEVTTARDGEEALARLKEAPLPDLVLLDLRMPKLNGFEVFEHMKKDPEISRIPVVFTSADANIDLEQMSKEMKACACLIKPFEHQEMYDKIRKCLRKSPSRIKK
jgi:CheY-like chemotaxis protein